MTNRRIKPKADSKTSHRAIYLTALMLSLSLFCLPYVHGQTEHTSQWRSATDKELASIIPDRAPVIAEHIETELRTASGITDGKGHYIAGVVLITAGYSANGRYSNFLLTQVPLKIGSTTLPEGHYLLGWTRGEDELKVIISSALTGKPLVNVSAVPATTIRGVQSIHIWPPSDHSVIQLGRFAIPYSIP
ncbi:hypothetical protein [Granulicella sp. L60]|uniref:hypothetical protein n=1 Tax=Granulicella sp. L60 TaxID=1641866 RepID=UPI0020B10A40|nr:hypothetical protein [Granulicella sp. L60]